MCNIHSKDKQERECCVCRICFLVSLAVSVLLIVGGFLMPPKGEIDGSVLTAVGELAVFPTLAYGFRAIMMGMEIHINHGNTHIEITKDDDESNR
jgi:hypothetical protein